MHQLYQSIPLWLDLLETSTKPNENATRSDDCAASECLYVCTINRVIL